MRALIVGKGHERGSLAAARSLTAAGWEVGSGAPSGRGLVSLSRAVARRHEIPLISRDGDAFIAAVREVVRETSYDVIFSSSDAELLALSEARADLGAVFPYPPHGSLLSVLDKKQLDPRAREVGFNVPEVIEDPDGQLDRLGYPVVVKDRLHSARLGIGIERVEATAARDPSEAEEALLEVRAHGGEPVVQRFVPGALMAYVCLIDSEGTVVAECQQLAEAIWPHPAGVSTRSQTIPVDSAVAESARALLSGLRWQGLAE
ncbi:MAG TPA: hypothetical protein VNP73_11960, partial [Actinomycetota bacterium]|nr:hypothetical protein [Actinomycetota bacterium]